MYDYKKMKPGLYTDRGFRVIITIHNRAREMSESSGAFTMSALISGLTGDVWFMMAAVDYLAEHGYLALKWEGPSSQDNIYTFKGW